MENIISKMIEDGMGNVIDRRRDPLLLEDEEYIGLSDELEECEEDYSNLKLTEEARNVIDRYLKLSVKVHGRTSDFSYMAGVRDTIKFLIQTGLLKK